jgi:hypothetical protein
MAKDTKKSSKNSTEEVKTTETKTEEVRKVAPNIPPGLVSIAMSHEDMQTFANLMSICAKTFEKLALDAAQTNDEASFAVLKARYQLSSAFAEKLVEACRMPEPISRDFH